MRLRTFFLATIVAGLAVRYALGPARKANNPLASDDKGTCLKAADKSLASDQEEKAPLAVNGLTSIATVQKPVVESDFHKIPWHVLALAFLHLLTFPTAEIVMSDLGLAPTDRTFRFFAGLAMTNYSVLGFYFTETLLVSWLTRSQWIYAEKTLIMKIWSFIIYLIPVIVGCFVFIHSWEGDTAQVGRWFGFGAVASGLLFAYGVKRINDFTHPPIFQESKKELRELVQLIQLLDRCDETLNAAHRSGRPLLLSVDACEEYKRNASRVRFIRRKWDLETDLVDRYGDWLLVRLASGRWSALSYELEGTRAFDSIVKEDGPWFCQQKEYQRPAALETEADALQAIVGSLENSSLESNVPDDYYTLHLDRVKNQLNELAARNK